MKTKKNLVGGFLWNVSLKGDEEMERMWWFQRSFLVLKRTHHYCKHHFWCGSQHVVCWQQAVTLSCNRELKELFLDLQNLKWAL